MRKLLLFIIAMLVILPARAQVAGMSTLSVLDMSVSPRTAALGMDYLSVFGSDISVAVDNPSLISHRLDNNVSIDFVSLFSKVNFGSLAYGVTTRHAGTFLFGFRFHNYGRFKGYNENDEYTGDFFAEDYLLSVGWAFVIDSNFSLGATLKPVFSQYAGYKAWALTLDVSGSYVSDDKRFSATVAGRNAGAQIVTFDRNVESLPFELSAALSYKLKNAPFRLYFAATELQRWNLRYADGLNPTSHTDQFTGETTTESPVAGFFDNLARHAVLGIELDIKNVFFARLGYNYRQTKEMQYAGNFNGSGFSFGVGIRVKGFEFSYARNNYHFSQAPNYFSLSTDLNRFFRKR